MLILSAIFQSKNKERKVPPDISHVLCFYRKRVFSKYSGCDHTGATLHGTAQETNLRMGTRTRWLRLTRCKFWPFDKNFSVKKKLGDASFGGQLAVYVSI